MRPTTSANRMLSCTIGPVILPGANRPIPPWVNEMISPTPSPTPPQESAHRHTKTQGLCVARDGGMAEPAGVPGPDVRDFTGGAAVPTSAISGAGLQPGVALPVGSATGARSERAALRVP